MRDRRAPRRPGARGEGPDDVAIVGFDDNALAAISDPPLTTIRQPDEKMADAAFQLATEETAEILAQPKRVILKPASRLAYTFRWEEPDPDDRETVVKLSLTEVGGGTELVLDQGPFRTDARLALHRDGWSDSCDKLAALASSWRTGEASAP